jgi:Thoeris protein ThsB, TIR-like domain
MSILSSQYNQNALLGLLKPIKRKVFISYHHGNDQAYYNLFSQYFSNTLDLFYDNSLERALDSTNAEYLNRKIREENIFGTSLTIVLCGPETWKRRWVDWEIHATLHHQHGLLGIILSTCTISPENRYLVPDRLHENIVSGYALWMHWTDDASILKTNMEAAIQRSNSQKSTIMNSATKMKKSLS